VPPDARDAALCAVEAASKTWRLSCCDRNERWWPYDNIDPSASIDPLLAEIDADPTGIFWG
jgi:hypothetical protein